MGRENIDKIAQTSEDRVLLAKLWDKIQMGVRKNIPTNTAFLSPRELEMSRFLFGELPGLYAFGGYADAERKMLVYLPEYLEESALMDEDSPVACIHAVFYEGDSPSHRDFLGALMGSGISRDSIGDICVGKESCDFFVKKEMAEFVLREFLSAGRVHLRLSEIPLSQASIPTPETKEIRDTLASLRLDSVISSGYRISRSLAVDYIHAGKVTVDGLSCEKPDKPIVEGARIAVRGLGKLKCREIGGLTKKGRISVVFDRYI